MKREKIIETISGAFILLWLYAAFTKLAGFSIFLKGLQHFPVINWISWPVAVAIPLLEIVLSVLLFFQRTRKKGLRFSLYLITLFTVYIGGMVTFENKKPCGCGGVLQSLSWTGHFIFNTVFIVLAYIGIKFYNSIDSNNGYSKVAH